MVEVRRACGPAVEGEHALVREVCERVGGLRAGVAAGLAVRADDVDARHEVREVVRA